ncbi:efflux RND transporter periplasmic adaptor subunit [Ideonella sp. YS5]|uniref:efflux RND transporter periplasmic adaptor subunit n=1 Tax=Ideonella sp. YS5 TaxID=3453714 RepID=UPI003EEC4B45
MNWPDLPCLAAVSSALATAVILAACHPGPDAAGTAAAASAPAAGPSASGAAIGVSTVSARQQDVAVTLSATGAVTPLSSVEVRPQVTSVIDKVHIREGQFVKAGDLLFTLDSRTNEALVAQAQAQVAKDQATLADAQRQLQRSRELLAQNFISQGQVDANQAAVDSAAALVQADRAALSAARVALSYAKVTAPSAGRVGTINVYAGTAVQANTTPLLTITQLQPIAIAFSLPQRHLADALGALPGGGAQVSANLPDGGATRQGRLKFVDNQVDSASGTVKVKAVFDNDDGKLWPGAFVTVNMTARTLRDAVVVPQASIIQGSRGDIVYVVQNGQAAARPVQVAYSQGDDAVVSGVKAGERIVLEGRQNLRPGATVVERSHEGNSAVAASGAQSKASAP